MEHAKILIKLLHKIKFTIKYTVATPLLQNIVFYLFYCLIRINKKFVWQGNKKIMVLNIPLSYRDSISCYNTDNTFQLRDPHNRQHKKLTVASESDYLNITHCFIMTKEKELKAASNNSNKGLKHYIDGKISS